MTTPSQPPAVMEADQLKPCPFCGERPVWDHSRTDGVRFSCPPCEEAAFEDFEQAASFWNRRPLASLDPAGEQEREALAKAREALDALLPPILCGESWDLPDAETVEITTTFGALKAAREARALLQQGDESKGPKTGEGAAQ